jgi:predicted nucleic acid-binding protein
MLYLDTSALAKLVTREAETERLRAYLAARANAIRFASAVAHAELLRAAHQLGDEAVATAREVLARIELVDVSRELLEHAGTLAAGHRLRTLDAIHVATAAVAGDRLEALVTYDPRMAEAAAALGLPVERP